MARRALLRYLWSTLSSSPVQRSRDKFGVAKRSLTFPDNLLPYGCE